MRELEVCEDVAVRNNVIIVMCDLCIRYTVMVDNYIPNISICLKDSDPFIRKQTLILLTNLLQVCVGTGLPLSAYHAGLGNIPLTMICLLCRSSKDNYSHLWFRISIVFSATGIFAQQSCEAVPFCL